MGLSRRGLLLGGGAIIALAACSKEPAHIDPAEPLPPIDDRFVELERRHNAFIGVSAVDVDSGRFVTHRADDPFAMCSTFKTYASARVLQKSQRGELALSDSVPIEAGDILANSPVTETRVGRTMTLAELCEATLQRSDNAAANYLLRMIGGPSAITEFARTIGDDRTRLDRWETALNSAVPGDPRDTSTPRALGDGYEPLLTGDALGAAERNQLLHWMRGNQTSSMRAGLHRAGPPPTRPAAATTAAPMTWASSTARRVRRRCYRS